MKNKIRITFNAPVTLIFVLTAFVVTLAGIISGGRLTRMLFMTYRSSLLSPLTYVRLLTHVLGHNGWDHFAGNMAYILLLGPMLEEKHGSGTILELICFTAVITGILNALLFPATALCGASGVVFAFILLTSFTGFKEGELPLTFILIAVIYLGQQITEGLFVRNNISNLSHIAGGLIGAAAGYALNKKKR